MRYITNIIRILFLALFLFLLVNGKAMLWLILFGAGLIAALIFGRIYCGYVCPMNAVIIPTEWLSKKLKIQTEKTPKWLKTGYFAWIAPVVSIAVMLLSKKLLHIDLPILPFWLVVSVLVTLRYKPAVFHNLLCPFGVLQKVAGRFAWQSKRVNKTACVGCKLCEKVCPSNAILVSTQEHKAEVDSSLCHQCMNCQGVCPCDAIHFRKKRKNNHKNPPHSLKTTG